MVSNSVWDGNDAGQMGDLLQPATIGMNQMMA